MKGRRGQSVDTSAPVFSDFGMKIQELKEMFCCDSAPRESDIALWGDGWKRRFLFAGKMGGDETAAQGLQF